MKRILQLIIFFVVCVSIVYMVLKKTTAQSPISSLQKASSQLGNTHPLSIAAMRKKQYPGSIMIIEQTLQNNSNYKQYIASYTSDGLKIYGLLTVPLDEKPSEGFPAIIFNHGYIPPTMYRTTERYVAYVDAFAKNGYVVFKPDYRGNGSSEGKPEGAYYSPAYVIDDLNAIASVRKLSYVNANKIGIWGHSMGGNITMRNIVVRPNDAKAVVIWGGVVGSYTELLNWHDPSYKPPPEELRLRNLHRAEIIQKYGTPKTNPAFWQSIDPSYYIKEITVPVQLHVGEADEEVPPSFSKNLDNKLQKAGKTVEFYSYPGSDHNISEGFNLAMQRSLAFFDKYVKGNM